MNNRNGFGYIDILIAIVIISLISMLTAFGVNSYYSKLSIIKQNDFMASLVRDELILIEENKNYENKTVGNVKIRYELESEVSVAGKNLKVVSMKLEDTEYGIEKNYKIIVK